MSSYSVILSTGGSWKEIDNENKYVREKIKNYGIHLPVDFNHDLLFETVKERAKLADHREISLSFQHPEYGYVIEVENDLDVSTQKTVICSTNKVVHIYLVVDDVPEEQLVVNRSTGKGIYNGVSENAKDDSGCPWRLYAVPFDVDSKVFHVRIFVDQHNCTLLQLHPNHKQANTDVLGTIVHDTMGKNYGRVWRPNDIAKDLNTRFQVNVTYKQAWRAKHYVYELFTGSPEESFAQLPIYFHYLKQHNPGTLAYIETDSEDRFEHYFFALGCSMHADNFRTDKHGVVSQLRDGFYSDDMTLAAIASAHKRLITSPPVAIFPHPLASDLTFSRNYRRIRYLFDDADAGDWCKEEEGRLLQGRLTEYSLFMQEA
ncbi:hypothetical protein LXL04_011788 [Taraxacum kok-saghyz]